jgi:hypothetical protein
VPPPPLVHHHRVYLSLGTAQDFTSPPSPLSRARDLLPSHKFQRPESLPRLPSHPAALHPLALIKFGIFFNRQSPFSSSHRNLAPYQWSFIILQLPNSIRSRFGGAPRALPLPGCPARPYFIQFTARHFFAAGLHFDKPVADLSALGFESRIGTIVLRDNHGYGYGFDTDPRVDKFRVQSFGQ